jgi:predicted RNA binding protein YcfA (HicA-like mRNA interferase family)
MPFLH